MPQESGTILVVDDDPAVGKVLTALLVQSKFDAVHVTSAEQALQTLAVRPFDLVLSDVRMPGMGGMELLHVLGQKAPDLPVVLLTAHGSVPMAVEAMKAGAADFMLKPFDREEILFVVGKALARAQRAALEPPVLDVVASGLVGTSAGMNEVHRMIRKVAPSTATVLLRGETGTGKELVAKALHEQSPRKDHPFVRVHCAALPDTLLESELFGYEKGAFTGAANRKPGRVELAHRGTLFLDEIGDISPQVQVKLLRVLQEREFERVGGTQTIKVDVRFVAATHRDLDALVAKGEFREDLYYRLNVVTLRVPPLRERGEDIEVLAEHFLRVLGAANGKRELALDRAGLQVLRAYSWPGNVRQLQNVMERLVVLGDGPILGKADVERELSSFPGTSSRGLGFGGMGFGGLGVEGPSGSAGPRASWAPRTGFGLLGSGLPGSGLLGSGDSTNDGNTEPSLETHRREAEREALLRALGRAGNNRTQAARLLNVSRRTLYNKLKEHGIE